MKKILFALIVIPFIIVSCTNDSVEEYYGQTDCEINEATFSGDVQPIIATNCAISGCHVSGTGLPAFTDYQKIAARASDIKSKTSGGIMPPASSGKDLTAAEVDKIACWVDSGAKNN